MSAVKAKAPTAQEVLNAKILKRDPHPDEERVRVRVRSCAESFPWGGYDLGFGTDADPEVDDAIPMRFAWATVDMFPSHFESLREVFSSKGCKPHEVDAAVRDLRSDLEGMGAVSDDASPREIVAAMEAGIRGTTSKTYRPSFPASYFATNRKKGLGVDFFPIVAIETEADYLAAKALEAETAPTSKKR